MTTPGEALRLPRELFWLYLIGPIVLAPLCARDVFDATFPEGVRQIAAGYVPFLTIPTACHAVYETAVPQWIARLSSRAARYATHTVLNTAIALAVCVLVKPLHDAVEGGDGSAKPLLAFAAISVVITWAFVLPSLLIQELRARADAVERAARAERQAALEAQLTALQARTNPHFLFNSINTIASLIPDNPSLAERTLERVADILRYALEASPARRVSLEEEVAIVRDYLEVQSARFGERLRFTLDLEPAASNALVPPLIVQPLVENAVLHGVSSRASGGQVRVSARRTDDAVTIEVSDDGPGPAASTHFGGTRTSVADLRKRLHLLYGSKGRLESHAPPEGGYRVRLEVPLSEAYV